jgi:hypothetical protein
MNSYKRALLIVTGSITVSLVVLYVAGPMLFGDMPDCDGESEAANYVRSLPDKRLQQIYLDMTRYHRKEGVPYQGYSRLNSDIPAEFTDLDIVKVRPIQKHIMVVGCMDNFMYMTFEGLDGEGTKQILLQYGEREVTTEVLWKAE